MLRLRLLHWAYRALGTLRGLLDRTLGVIERGLDDAPTALHEASDETVMRGRGRSRAPGPPDHWLRLVRERAPQLLHDERTDLGLEAASQQAAPDWSSSSSGQAAATESEPAAPTSTGLRTGSAPLQGPRARRSARGEMLPNRSSRPTRDERPAPEQGQAVLGDAEPGRQSANADPERLSANTDPARLSAHADAKTPPARPSDGSAGSDWPAGLAGTRHADVRPEIDGAAEPRGGSLRTTSHGGPDGQRPHEARHTRAPGPRAEATMARQRSSASERSQGWPLDPQGAARPNGEDSGSAQRQRPGIRTVAAQPETATTDRGDPWPELPPQETDREALARELRRVLDRKERTERVQREQQGRLWSE